jgi:hypothetical protein
MPKIHVIDQYRRQQSSIMALRRTAIVACLSIAVGSVPGAAAQSKGETRMVQTSSHAAKGLASDRPIGHIEPVFEFYDAMPTGVTVAADGRIFINFPRWGDEVPFTVGVIRNGKVVPSSILPIGSGYSTPRRLDSPHPSPAVPSSSP